MFCILSPIYYPLILTLLPCSPGTAASTTSRTGNLSFTSSTCVIIPTLIPPPESLSKDFITTSMVFLSSVPNPSSRKKKFNDALFFICILLESARARENDVRNVSPPDRVEGFLLIPPQKSSLIINSPSKSSRAYLPPLMFLSLTEASSAIYSN